MMYEPDERTTTIEAQKEVLKDTLATDNSTILLAEENGRCVSFLEAAPSGATGMSPAWWSGPKQILWTEGRDGAACRSG
jgi:hypothetical protein